jgi:predicted PurR-regulated permease PerM
MSFDSLSDKTFTERVLIVIGFVVLTFLLIALLYFTFDVILLIFAAALLAIFLRGLADLLGYVINASEGWRLVIVSLVLLVVLAGAIALLAPSVAEQVGHLRDELPKSARAAADYISQFGWGQTILSQLPSLNDVLGRISTVGLLTGVGGVFTTTLGAVGNFFVTILLAFYFAAEPKFYIFGFIKLFPKQHRYRVKEVVFSIGDMLGWWLIGKACSMLFIGLLTWFGLWILGVPLALTLGILAGLLSFIPNFGPIMSAIPAILIAFIDSPIAAVYVAGLFIVVQLIESNIVTPLIERETVELPPALTIMSQLALAVLVGGPGLILATPLLAVIMVLVQMVYIEDVLGDRKTEVKEKGIEKQSQATAKGPEATAANPEPATIAAEER